VLRVKVWTSALAISGAIFYLLCIVGRFVAPETGYHESLLEAVLPGFEWLTPLGFVAGLVGSMVYGAVMGAVFSTVHNAMARTWKEA
jgi:uncharacterized protein DUF5676